MLTQVLLLASLSVLPVCAQSKPAVTPQADGFRGIWFELGQKSEHGDKYSGGLGTSTHNYDTGSIYIEEDGTSKIIGPTGTGPQKWGVGGEIELWTSKDHGATWAKQREVTKNSPHNHSYARRPRHAHPDFYAYWADGDADKLSKSHLYLTNLSGDKVWRLPYDMTGDFATPELVEP